MNKLLRGALFLMVLLAACTNDKPKDEEQNILEGKWQIKQALRKGNVTDALKGIYFEFLPESKMISNFNLSVEARESTYTLKENILVEKNQVEGERTFIIEKVDTENLVLSTDYQNILFKLILVKNEPTADQ
ncbi:MAG: hypothetical protein AAF985_17850 [Bacteroidota bacterium]